jgi:hypothetical protein
MARRRRRRSRAKENPLPLIPLLLLGGAAAAIGAGVYFATRPQTNNALPSGSAPVAGPAVPLANNQYYWIASSSADGLPGSAQDFANQVAGPATGWANVCVVYYAPTTQGSIPTDVTVPQGGYVAHAMWSSPSMTSDQAGTLLGVPPGVTITTAGTNTGGLACFGLVGLKGSSTTSSMAPTASGGGGGGIVGQVNGAINTAQNTANNVQGQIQGASDTVNNITSQFGG